MTDIPKHHRQKELLAYAQGFLGPQEQTELEEHLKHCADCQKTLEEVKQFLPALQQALTPKEPSTEEMLARVRQQMRSPPPPKEPFFTRVRMGLMAGGAALATTVLILAQPLLHQTEAPGIAKQEPDAGAEETVAAPHRPNIRHEIDPDAGMDGGPRGRQHDGSTP